MISETTREFMARHGDTVGIRCQDLEQELARKDAEIARLRAALERCREMFRQCSRASEGDEQEGFEIMEKMCADALKGENKLISCRK